MFTTLLTNLSGNPELMGAICFAGLAVVLWGLKGYCKRKK